MTGLLDQAVNCDDADRAAKIIQNALGIENDDVVNYCFQKAGVNLTGLLASMALRQSSSTSPSVRMFVSFSSRAGLMPKKCGLFRLSRRPSVDGAGPDQCAWFPRPAEHSKFFLSPPIW